MWKYVKKYLHFAVLAAIFMVGEVLMDLIQPKLMSQIVDKGVLGIDNQGIGDMHFIFIMGILMIVLVLFGGCCGSLNNAFVHLTGQNVGNDMRKDCFCKIMSVSFPQMDYFGTGSMITRVTNDITQVETFVAQFVRGMIRTTMLTIGSIIFMFRLNRRFGFVVLCAFPFISGFMIFCLYKANPKLISLQNQLDKMNEMMQEDVSGIRIIKACVRESYEKLRFGKNNEELTGIQLYVLMIFAFMNPVMNALMYIVVAIILMAGSVQVAENMTTPGTIMAAITYTTQLLNGILMLTLLFQNISKGLVSWKRIKEILCLEPELKDGTWHEKNIEHENSINHEYKTCRQHKPQKNIPYETTELFPRPEGACITGCPLGINFADDKAVKQRKAKIEFQEVSFAFPGTDYPVLSHVNLKIWPGETIGIMGATGSGKTALVSLIPRLYDVTSGCVRIDGIDVKNYRQKDLRDRIAMALQKSELFGMSIKDNIVWGNPEATEEEVRQAAAIAQAHDFIEELPEGYDTIVSERGMSLSGGQRQRVSIARTVIKPADILIFDDSASALDLKTEADFYEALCQTRPECTKIIIAQRIASVRRADRIIVLGKGTIEACGTHEELMKTCKTYRDIYHSQIGDENE